MCLLSSLEFACFLSLCQNNNAQKLLVLCFMQIVYSYKFVHTRPYNDTTVNAFSSWTQRPHPEEVVVLPLQKRRQGHDLVYQNWIRDALISRRWYCSQFCHCPLDDIEEWSFPRRWCCCLVCYCARVRSLAHTLSFVYRLLTRRLTSWTAKRLPNFQVGSSFTTKKDNKYKSNRTTQPTAWADTVELAEHWAWISLPVAFRGQTQV